MKLDDFNNIDFKNAGSLPMPVKLVLLGFLFLILLGLGYWFLWNPAIDEFNQAKAKEEELRQVFLTKKAQAIKVEAYKQQMIDIEKTFGALLKQLPDKSQPSWIRARIRV
jgi:type IV pilus assembly protein PilO